MNLVPFYFTHPTLQKLIFFSKKYLQPFVSYTPNLAYHPQNDEGLRRLASKCTKKFEAESFFIVG
jgi:hypothetical protein